MATNPITATPCAGAMGAVLSGVDLAAGVDDDVFATIHQALLDHSVIFLRNQDISPDQQVAFAKRFGDIHYHPFVKGMVDHPEIIQIEKKAGDSRNFGGSWHTDQMFSPTPAMATMLYAKDVPGAGGDTLYASLYAAYDALSEAMKDMLADLKTVNIGNKARRHGGQSRTERYAKEMSAMETRDPGVEITNSVHPLIRTHPETGRKALYVGSHSQQIDGMTPAESEPILQFLKAHAIRPEFTCRFSWEVGSMAIWDNRCALHHAVNDYPGQHRRMHRITIKGDTPF